MKRAGLVLAGGPLKGLVELAEEREEDIPALVYEARPIATDVAVEEPPQHGSPNRTASAETERRDRERRKWQIRKEQKEKRKDTESARVSVYLYTKREREREAGKGLDNGKLVSIS